MQLNKCISSSALLAIVALALGACTGQKDPAKQALDGAYKAVDAAAAPDANKDMPGELKVLQSTVASLNASFDKGDSAGVLAGAPPLKSKTEAAAAEVNLQSPKAAMAAK
jgi:hypothetical protein